VLRVKRGAGKRRVLVTGANSQLGLELQLKAPARVEVIALDRRALDLAEPQAIRDAVTAARADWIINAAAYTGVDRAESEPEAAFRINRDAVRALAEATADGATRLLHISTDFVFDGAKSSPYLPGDATNPLSVYGASKLAGERAALEGSGGSAVIVRTAWLHSEHRHNFVRTVLRLLRERTELLVVADQVGTPTSAATLAKSLWKMIGDGVEPGSTWHATDAGAASWYDFAVAVREMARGRRKLAPVLPITTAEYPTAARRPAYSVLEKSATWARYGVAPHWRDALAPVVEAALGRRKQKKKSATRKSRKKEQ
jgi:dTDP-4-dehydrorhamnose reductase